MLLENYTPAENLSELAQRREIMAVANEAIFFDFHNYFEKMDRLGAYSVIHLHADKPDEEIQIVIEQDADWIQKSVERFFGKETVTLDLEKIRDFISRGAKKLVFNTLAHHLGVVGGANSDHKKFAQFFYLDEYTKSQENHSIAFAIIAQLLFERYTKLDTRLAVVDKSSAGKKEYKYILLVRNPLVSSQFLLFDPASPASKGLDMKDGGFIQEAGYQIREGALRVSKPLSVWNDKNKIVTIIGENGRELSFNVSGRTPTEKRFKREEALIKTAAPNDLVPIEIYFLPYFRPLGHTSLRIGEALYELSMKGWKSHSSGADSSRAFLFNNPFFRSQYNVLSKFGVPPISIGKVILIKKSQVDLLQSTLENLLAAKHLRINKFNILTNNCNQGIMRVLHGAGIEGFQPKGYIAFSSVLSFRRYILEDNHKVDSLNIYPLPNIKMSEEELRKWIPNLLYRHNNPYKEFVRAFPRYFHNIAYMNYVAAKNFATKLFKKQEV